VVAEEEEAMALLECQETLAAELPLRLVEAEAEVQVAGHHLEQQGLRDKEMLVHQVQVVLLDIMEVVVAVQVDPLRLEQGV
jgi:hypothetical protein